MTGYVAIALVLTLTQFQYYSEGAPGIENEAYLRVKRSDAQAFSNAVASAGAGNVPFDAAIIPKLARGDFSNLDFNFEPPAIPPNAHIVSRFGEGEGTGIRVAGNAQGPNGAFSSTSAGADSNGKVQYSVKTAEY